MGKVSDEGKGGALSGAGTLTIFKIVNTNIESAGKIRRFLI